MRDLASGRVLEPLSEGETENVALSHVDPADYPTYLGPPVFEYCRRHREYRAAWIFNSPAGHEEVDDDEKKLDGFKPSSSLLPNGRTAFKI
jgi:hypothetical protein